MPLVAILSFAPLATAMLHWPRRLQTPTSTLFLSQAAVVVVVPPLTSPLQPLSFPRCSALRLSAFQTASPGWSGEASISGKGSSTSLLACATLFQSTRRTVLRLLQTPQSLEPSCLYTIFLQRHGWILHFNQGSTSPSLWRRRHTTQLERCSGCMEEWHSNCRFNLVIPHWMSPAFYGRPLGLHSRTPTVWLTRLNLETARSVHARLIRPLLPQLWRWVDQQVNLSWYTLILVRVLVIVVQEALVVRGYWYSLEVRPVEYR